MKKLLCTLLHWWRWKRLSRVHRGWADWLDTWECQACGDRWCRQP